jgi:hypothetical protein
MSVFISFIHEEERVATAVQALLKEKLGEEFRVFLSTDLRAGHVWLERIREELTQARVIVSLLSPRSIARPWVNFEAGAAWFAHKPIIPACFGGLELASLPKPYSDFQAIDLRQRHYELVRDAFGWLTGKAEIAAGPWPPDDPAVRRLYDELDGLPY